jgi:hypothetical protein
MSHWVMVLYNVQVVALTLFFSRAVGAAMRRDDWMVLLWSALAAIASIKLRTTFRQLVTFADLGEQKERENARERAIKRLWGKNRPAPSEREGSSDD